VISPELANDWAMEGGWVFIVGGPIGSPPAWKELLQLRKRMGTSILMCRLG